MTPIPIAHRGFWHPDKTKQNSLEAIEAAFDVGFGVEIDVRRRRSELVLSHDPPTGDHNYPTLNDALFLASKSTAPVLLDLKEAGTEAAIALLVFINGVADRTYLFDFGLCQGNPHEALSGFPDTKCLIRVSDRQSEEKEAHFPKPWCRGTWLDQWDSDWVTQKDIRLWKKGGPVFIAAPDLHTRPFDFALLNEWTEATGICTDVPHLVQKVQLGVPEPHPYYPWWTS